jgi:hypothetical protein
VTAEFVPQAKKMAGTKVPAKFEQGGFHGWVTWRATFEQAPGDGSTVLALTQALGDSFSVEDRPAMSLSSYISA